MATAAPPTRSTTSAIERVPWDDALARMNWRAGEHVTLIGPTGRGKTEALVLLLNSRSWRVFLGTKRRDSTQSRLRTDGYRLVHDPAEINPQVSRRFLFVPRFPRHSTADHLRAAHTPVFENALVRLREQMGWTIGIDESPYLAHYLGLTRELQLLWLQGRSEGTSMVANTQRPRFIPLEAYSQATHLLMWSNPDLSDVRRIADFASFDRRRVLAILGTNDVLGSHDFLYVNTVTRDMFITNTRW